MLSNLSVTLSAPSTMATRSELSSQHPSGNWSQPLRVFRGLDSPLSKPHCFQDNRTGSGKHAGAKVPGNFG